MTQDFHSAFRQTWYYEFRSSVNDQYSRYCRRRTGGFMQPISQIADPWAWPKAILFPTASTRPKFPWMRWRIRTAAPRESWWWSPELPPHPPARVKPPPLWGWCRGWGKLGHRAAVTLREPTLGPIFGIKGGGTGGGKARVLPEDEINIHFTGDAHAVASAHNLLAALVDNAVYRGQIPDLDATGIQWSRVTDASDRALRDIVAESVVATTAPCGRTRFDIVSASEIMAILGPLLRPGRPSGAPFPNRGGHYSWRHAP